MSNPYTISTVDDTEGYNQLITGRVDDLSQLLTHIAQGHSVALIGERRIGKTSVLILLKDIINGRIEQYRSKLIDLTLQSAIDTLKAKVPVPCKVIYIDLQSLKKPKEERHEELASTLHKTLCDEGLLHVSQISVNSNILQLDVQPYYKTVIEVLQALQAAHRNGRFAIVFDEIESLQEFPDAKQIERNLRSIVHSCPNVCLILAGADGWHKQIKDNTSPLANNLVQVYLKAAARFPIETYLVQGLLSDCLPLVSNMSDIVQTVITWTECKPYYVQAVCYAIVKKYGSSGHLPYDWKQVIEAQVLDDPAVDGVLSYFYQGNNLDDQTKSVLALLANEPKQTTKQITARLGYSVKVTTNKIKDMISLDKIIQRGIGYHILGTLIEKWGEQKLEAPSRPSSSFQLWKWVIAGICIIVAFLAYKYNNPDPQTFTYSISGSVIYIEMPGSLEQGETGTATVSVQNTGTQSSENVYVFLSSVAIDYHLDGTNRLTFQLTPQEKKPLNPTYVVGPSDDSTITSEVVISTSNQSTPYKYTFPITRRPVPLQRWWIVITGVFTAISAFFSGKDLWQLGINLLAFVNKRPAQ